MNDNRMPFELATYGSSVDKEKWIEEQRKRDLHIVPENKRKEGGTTAHPNVIHASDRWAGSPTPELVKKPPPIRKPIDSDSLPRPLEKLYHIHLGRLAEHLSTSGGVPDLVKQPVPDQGRAAVGRAWILSKARPTAARLDELAREFGVDPQIDIQADLFEVWLWCALTRAAHRGRLYELSERRQKAEAAVEQAKVATVQVSENFDRLNAEHLGFQTMESAKAIRARERDVAAIVLEILEVERCNEAREHIESTKLIAGIKATAEEVKLEQRNAVALDQRKA